MTVKARAEITLAGVSDGAKGDTGNGIESTAITYQSSTSNTTEPTGTWSSTIPSVAAGSYLWTRTIITYTDNTTSTSYSVAKQGSTGAKGDKGDTGATGAAGADGKMLYGTCSTAAATAAKVATATGFELVSGTSVSIKFTYANTAASPTLNINSLGAKAVYVNGTRYAYWAAGSTVTFVYDGTQFQVCSVPVYASTVTVGNPGGGNVYIDSSSVSIRKSSNTLANFTSSNGTTFVKGYQNLMLCAGTADAPESVYFTIPPASDGTESDLGMGLRVDGTKTHGYIASSDGVGDVIDWVVAKGTSGIWTYYKWASGRAECFGVSEISITGWNDWGSVYESAERFQFSYPFTFVDNPVEVASFELGNGFYEMGVESTRYEDDGTGIKTKVFYALRPAVGGTGKGKIRIYAAGRWK